jgi:predicted transcriptional regulator
MAKINRINEYLEKAGYERGHWSAFSRYSGVPIWRLSRVLSGKHPPNLSDMYRITDAFERKFKVKLDPRDIFLP